MVLVDYIGFFYMRQYFWPHNVYAMKGNNEILNSCLCFSMSFDVYFSPK